MIVTVMQDCGFCRGDGEIDINPVGGGGTRPCPHCSGTGQIQNGAIDLSDLAGAVTDVMDKCNDIFEKVSGEKSASKKKSRKKPTTRT
jgi:DnaJ-class molecular chaperone